MSVYATRIQVPLEARGQWILGTWNCRWFWVVWLGAGTELESSVIAASIFFNLQAVSPVPIWRFFTTFQIFQVWGYRLEDGSLPSMPQILGFYREARRIWAAGSRDEVPLGSWPDQPRNLNFKIWAHFFSFFPFKAISHFIACSTKTKKKTLN